MTQRPASIGPRSPRSLLGLATGAVAFAAADTYVVVLVLPDMMSSVGLSVEQLQRAAPIISGFLLGYVAMLPLIGRIADVRGRLPVLVAALLVFAFGSLVTAAAYDLPSLVAGRFLQGIGGGGLVPVTLALVADLYPAQRRGVPLGVVGAVQELGSVLGPLYGAVVLMIGTWRAIFWINLAVGLILAAAIVHVGRQPDAKARRLDLVGTALLALWLVTVVLVLRQPEALVTSVRWGAPFVPFADGGSIWLSPIGLVAIGLGAALVAWLLVAPQPLVDLRDWWASARQADLLGALLLSIALGGVILAFATADPEVQAISPAGPLYLAVAAAAMAILVLHQRRAADPLVPAGALRERPAWGALLVSFLVGSALIAALVDIPVFARVSGYGDTQVKAALVLVVFLIALPVGAFVGGFLTRSRPAGVVTALGMGASALAFCLMSTWNVDALHHPAASVTLVLAGFGFGLAVAPVNAALLAATDSSVHGVSSALLVVARMTGMLVGISALTTLGLRRYYAVSSGLPSPAEVCGDGVTRCDAYSDLLRDAAVAQVNVVFLGAAVCAALAGALALLLFRGARTRSTPGVAGSRTG